MILLSYFCQAFITKLLQLRGVFIKKKGLTFGK